MRRRVVQLHIKKTKNNEVIFSLAWNIIFTDNLKVLVLKFVDMKNMVFLSQKVDGNMIFTDYWKILVLIFSEMGNTVFSWAKKLIERWYLLITEKVLFWIFGDGKYGIFLSQEVDGKIIFTGYWEVLVLNFLVMGNTVLLSAKKLMERWYLYGLFELSMIFQDLGNMVFRAVLLVQTIIEKIDSNR